MSVEAIDQGLTVLVLSDDPILRSGVAAVLQSAGVNCLGMGSDQVLSVAAPVWDLVVVLPESSRRPDRFACAAVVSKMVPRIGGVSIAGFVARPVRMVAELRFAESGFTYLAPYRTLEVDPLFLVDAMRNGGLPNDLRLASVAALRDQLGFRPHGSIEEFLAIAGKQPPEVWLTNRAQARLGITRQEVEQLRRSAAEIAGLPVPVSSRFSSSAVRAAADQPTWSHVRDFVRAAWGLAEPDRP